MPLRKIAVALGLVACVLVAGVSAKDILNPKMMPDKGTYEKPHGTLGKKTETAWSATTLAAGVGGKPLEGKVVTVVGEIIDFSCYAQLGKHGTKHRDCGQKCLKNGQPIGLLAKDGTVYILMDEEHDQRRDGITTFRKAAIDSMAYVMEVSGTLSDLELGKTKVPALYVRGYLKQ